MPGPSLIILWRVKIGSTLEENRNFTRMRIKASAWMMFSPRRQNKRSPMVGLIHICSLSVSKLSAWGEIFHVPWRQNIQVSSIHWWMSAVRVADARPPTVTQRTSVHSLTTTYNYGKFKFPSGERSGGGEAWTASIDEATVHSRHSHQDNQNFISSTVLLKAIGLNLSPHLERPPGLNPMHNEKQWGRARRDRGPYFRLANIEWSSQKQLSNQTIQTKQVFRNYDMTRFWNS